MQLGTKLSDVDVGAVLDLLSQYGDRDAMLAPHRKHRTVARGGCIAGQAVSSAIQDLYFGGRGGVYNDIDLFVPSNIHVWQQPTRNRIATVHVAEVRGCTDYGQLTHSLDSSYRVVSSDRDEMLNLVVVNDFVKRGQSLTEKIVSSFDLNCVQVGIDLITHRLFWTPAFEHFLLTRQLEVENMRTPAHTAIRVARKMRELQQVWVDTDRVMRSLAGALFRLEVSELPPGRERGDRDPLTHEMASIANRSARSVSGSLYGQRRFGRDNAAKAREAWPVLEKHFEMQTLDRTQRVFTLTAKGHALPDEAFLRLACSRHVVEYAALEKVFLRPHKRAVRERGAALLRVDPVSLTPLDRGPAVWPVHQSSSVTQMMHERVAL